MLFPTHRRAGIEFGLIMANIFLILGIYSSMKFDGIELFAALLLTISGAIMGAEFPDIDSPNSIPRRHHPIIGIAFDFFHIKHRGKFSHSVLSETVFWISIFVASIFFMSSTTFNKYTSENSSTLVYIAIAIFGIACGKQLSMIISALSSLVHSNFLSFSGFYNMLLFIMTDDEEFSKKAKYKKQKSSEIFLINVVAYGISVLFFYATLSGNSYNENIDVITTYLLLYIIAIWFGVMSHLVMDVSTKEGIYLGIGNKRFSPVKMMQATPILRMFVPNNEFKTGTGWETSVRIFVSIIDIILFFLLLFELMN